MILCLQQGDDGQALSVTDRVLLFALAAQARAILLPPALHYLPHLGFWTLVSCSISDTAHNPEGPLQIIAGVSSRAVQPEPESVADGAQLTRTPGKASRLRLRVRKELEDGL